MTMVVTILLGIGVVFISSAIDCTPLVATFQKIISNQPIDWSGTANCQPAQAAPSLVAAPGPTTTGQANTNVVPPLGSGRCPPGYQMENGNCVRVGAIR